ncbi:MAG: type II toxin-antitoxin system PemK/MazF family toxin [Planctomycetota bacterium]|nr:MAG: type II toxin-antitoxin system PemK/MazF family toxin [Planctomycetota bacterium]
MEKGELYWVDLGYSGEAEPGYRRPALIVQADSFNLSGIPSVMVAPLSTNLKLGKAPGNVVLKSTETGLSKDSVVVVSQIVSIRKSRLEEAIGTIDPSLLLLVDNGMRLLFDL